MGNDFPAIEHENNGLVQVVMMAGAAIGALGFKYLYDFLRRSKRDEKAVERLLKSDAGSKIVESILKQKIQEEQQEAVVA